MKRLRFLWLVLLPCLTAAQSVVSIRTFSTEDGLSQRNVNDFLQDGRGYIWLSTRNGLDRYDGYSFANFRTQSGDPVHLPSQCINRIFCSARNHIWCLSNEGNCYRFNTETLQYEDPAMVFPGFEHRVSEIHPLANGITYLLAGNRLYRVDENQSFAKEAFQTSSEIRHIEQINLDRLGREWVMADDFTLILDQHNPTYIGDYDFFSENGDVVFLGNKNGYLACFDESSRMAVTLAGPAEFGFTAMQAMLGLDDRRICCVFNEGVVLYDPSLSRLQRFFQPMGRIREVFQDRYRGVWFLSDTEYLWRLDMDREALEEISYPRITESPLSSRFTLIFEDHLGCLWVKPYLGEFGHYNPSSKTLTQATYLDHTDFNPLRLRTLRYTLDRQRNLWLDCENGFMRVSFQEREAIVRIGPERTEGRAMLLDRLGRLWVGWKKLPYGSKARLSVYEPGMVFAGNLNADGERVADIDTPFPGNVYSLMEDREGNIWVGTKPNGLFVLEPETERSYRVHAYPPGEGTYDLPDGNIYSLLQDHLGHIYLGTCKGLVLADTGNGLDNLRFLHKGNGLDNYPALSGNEIRCLYETKGGVVCLGSTGGLITFRSDFGRPQDIHFRVNSIRLGNQTMIGDDIYHISETHDGALLLSTLSNTLSRCDTAELLNRRIGFSSYLPGNKVLDELILSAVEVAPGNLWVATEDHIHHFLDHVLATSFSIDMSEGKPLKDENGVVLFGLGNGILSAYGKAKHPQDSPVLSFSELTVFGRDEQRTESLVNRAVVKLGRTERNGLISFMSDDFRSGEAIEYAYRHKGLGDHWIDIGKTPKVYFNQLSAGKHLLEVKSTNGSGEWMDNTVSLLLDVAPRFYETPIAIGLYLVVLLLTSYYIFFLIHKRKEIERNVAMEKRRTENELKFFTDISHELRTPLTLIASPLDEIARNELLSVKGQQQIDITRQNVKRLLQLVNQLLFFRKVQEGQMKVNVERRDVNPLVLDIYRTFLPGAQSTGIEFSLDLPDSPTVGFLDVDKVEKILYNLLSNAFKNTPSGKSIRLNVQGGDRLTIQVSDQGKGIPKEQLGQLFTRFTSLDQDNPSLSTGIGLSLVKELVDLMGGHIRVESEPGKGSDFFVSLPFRKEDFTGRSNVETIIVPDESADPQEMPSFMLDKRPSVLIVEDNPDMRTFMVSILDSSYRVIEAGNGKEALDLIRKDPPGAIVSDIMMPGMDGYELLTLIRNDRSISHIPVILLSAKNAEDDKINGLGYGADDYITKPFSPSYLTAKLSSLLKNRQSLFENYLEQDNGKNERLMFRLPRRPDSGDFDSRFVEQLVENVKENLQNPEFHIEELANRANLSRPVFYRKVKSLMGVSPVELVTKLRVQRATQLLESKQLSVSEISEQCGFSSPQYFAKVFKRYTGIPPKEYQQHPIKSRF